MMMMLMMMIMAMWGDESEIRRHPTHLYSWPTHS